MTGSHKKFIPENSNNRAVILVPQGFARNCLRFYATLGLPIEAPPQTDELIFEISSFQFQTSLSEVPESFAIRCSNFGENGIYCSGTI
jgi:hypothetical protein